MPASLSLWPKGVDGRRGWPSGPTMRKLCVCRHYSTAVTQFNAAKRQDAAANVAHYQFVSSPVCTRCTCTDGPDVSIASCQVNQHPVTLHVQRPQGTEDWTANDGAQPCVGGPLGMCRPVGAGLPSNQLATAGHQHAHCVRAHTKHKHKPGGQVSTVQRPKTVHMHRSDCHSGQSKRMRGGQQHRQGPGRMLSPLFNVRH